MPERTTSGLELNGIQPCRCGFLLEVARSPDMPIEFDDALNEFHIVRPNGFTVMRYCPFCGDRLPSSHRGRLSRMVTATERARLKREFSHLATIDSVLSSLGPPDRDRIDGLSDERVVGRRRKRVCYRLLTYDRLSPTAYVSFAVAKDGTAQLMFLPKARMQAPPATRPSRSGPAAGVRR
jgi:hypothetical protein